MDNLEQFLDEFIQREYPDASVSMYDLENTVTKLNWKIFNVAERESSVMAFIQQRAPREIRVRQFDDGPEEQDEAKQFKNIVRTIYNYVCSTGLSAVTINLFRKRSKKVPIPTKSA